MRSRGTIIPGSEIFVTFSNSVPTYLYETTDRTRPIRQFEVKQAFAEKPLLLDPATGELVRRVITGGYGIVIRGGAAGPSVGSCGSHDEIPG
jgi:predicted nucleic acid-binding Zn ribbon protein